MRYFKFMRGLFWLSIVVGFFLFREQFDMLAYSLFGEWYEQLGYYTSWLD